MFNKYPYTDFHELNLDWFLKQFKELVADWEDFHTTISAEWAAVQQEWTDTKEAWQTLYNYVHDYFDNLDVQAEIDHKLDEMVEDGTMDALVQPYINAYANDLRVLEARMDTFASLPDGSTAGDAELLVLLHNESSIPVVQASVEAKGLAVLVLKKLPLSSAISPAHSLYDMQGLSYKHLEDQLLADHPFTFDNHRKQLKALLPNWQGRKILTNNHPTLEQLVDSGIAFSVGPEFQTAETKARRIRYIPRGNQPQVLIAVYNPANSILSEMQRYLELLREELES